MVEFIDVRSSKNGAEGPSGAQIKALREKLGWTQDTLATKMKEAGLPISQSEVSLFERGLESQPVKAGYKETHVPTQPEFLGKGYHSYRERLRLFFLREGVFFPDEERVVVSDLSVLYAPFIAALSVLDLGAKPKNADDASSRLREFEHSVGVGLSIAAQWTLSKHYKEAREAYVRGDDAITWGLEE